VNNGTGPSRGPQEGREMSEYVYVVRDASGEYLTAKGERRPASDEAAEYESRQEAEAACTRATDRVLSREVE
jgi:hypothetical protein